MADKFIDQDETKIYGPHTSANIRKRLIGRISAFDDALKYVADQVDANTAAVAAAVAAARGKDAEGRKGVQKKAPLLKQARALLGKFSKHLGTHDAGVVDRKVFFTKDGTAGGVGTGAHDVLLAVTHIKGKLSATDVQVRDAVYWRDQFDTMMKSLGPVIAFSDDARADRQSLTPEVEASRQAWLNGYLAARSLVESVLRLLGRLEQLPIFFYDLRVPAGTKVTEAPPEEPDESLVEEDAEEGGDEGRGAG